MVFKSQFCSARKFLLLLFLAVPCYASASAELEEQLSDYCHTYLSALVEMYAVQPVDRAAFQVIKVVRDRHPIKLALNFLGNLVSPPSARIHSAYQCVFHINVEEALQRGSMDLILVKDKSFADYTTWEDTQIINKGEVWRGDIKYYVVVKYLTVKGQPLVKLLKSNRSTGR